MDRAEAPLLATLHDHGTLLGVALRTPPWPLISSGLPTDPDVLDAFVSAWLDRDPALPGATGPRANAEAVAAAWVRVTNGTFREAMATRLYRLGALTSPVVDGTARLATLDDLDLVVRWRYAFDVEAHGHPTTTPDEGPAEVRRMIELGYGVMLWEDRGETVSLAVSSTPLGRMSRVGPVYTPPEHRGHGYGSAVTAAASSYARRAGAEDVLLFTDLANPTSNSIYRKIGYRPVYDSTELTFARLPSEG
jgi:GNAT superfamily N-acetyltransferase